MRPFYQDTRILVYYLIMTGIRICEKYSTRQNNHHDVDEAAFPPIKVLITGTFLG
jgi:hypothetical protein